MSTNTTTKDEKLTPADGVTRIFGDRATRLMTGDSGLCCAVRAAVEAPHGVDEPVLDFTASDETIDRYAEVLSAAGWELDAYRRNPVFLNSHQYSGIEFVLGTAKVTEVVDGKLRQRIRFAVEHSPIARMAYGMYKSGTLRAVSVGFIPKEWEEGGSEAPFERKFTRQELVEVSAVSVPANPNALADALQRGAVARTDIADAIDLLRFLESQMEASQVTAPDFSKATPDNVNPHTPDRAAGVDDHAAHLLRALETAHRILCGHTLNNLRQGKEQHGR